MGNNGSRTGQIAQHFETESQWTQSFPRNSHTSYQQHKVLPEKGIHKKLRSTNNGAILHSGGTISRGHQQKTLSLERESKSFKIFRTNSTSSNPSDREYEEKLPTRSYIPHHSGGNRYTTRYETKKPYKEQMKKFGSEPDLRNPNLINHQDDRDKFRGKKKYKAPLPPNLVISEKPHLHSYEWNQDATEPITRRSRLFKTRSELKKRCSSPVNQSLELAKTTHDPKRNISDKNNVSNVELRNRSRKSDYSVNRLSLPEMSKCNSIPEFQSELKEVVQRIKSTKRELPEIDRISNNKYVKSSNNQEKEKLKTLDHNINKKENLRNRIKSLELDRVSEKDNVVNKTAQNRGQSSGKESTPEKPFQNGEKAQPCKLYYFGMKEPIQDDLNKSYSNTTSLPHKNYSSLFPFTNSSGSDLSSEIEMEESHISNNGIALQLRPILPKKQLEIPRFSPAAAWKQLSAFESNFAPSTINSEDPPIFMEDRIEKLSRPPPPPAMQTGPRSSYDKSGDSGISGDAGPVGFDDIPEIVTEIRSTVQLPMVPNRNPGMSWTPQQDLGEDESSTDEELQNQVLRTAPVKFTPKPNVFSLSLPRDNQLSSYINRNFANKKEIGMSNSFRFQRGNWFLSKSAPNSLNNGLNSLELPNSQQSEDIDQVHEAIINNSQNVSRVMYLPESETTYRKNQNVKSERLKNKDAIRDNSSVDCKLNLLSKSCENISTQVQSSPEPEDLQDPPHIDDILKIHKSKRFSFQSTIRQIERKRLAEKLSKEAEKKEKQRLSELAAMQKVEEEFQRKRAREKASIRQQLRLFSLDDTAWSNVPSNDVKDNVPIRSDPDGAVSSAASSPILLTEKTNSHPIREDHAEMQKRQLNDAQDEIKRTQMTQVLSEYRQSQREYKDFRGSPRYMGDLSDGHYTKQTTIHPQVTYNMPKATSHQSENEPSNYRKQFAHGVKTSRSGESTYSDDSQPNNRNYSPKIYRNNRTSISRF